MAKRKRPEWAQIIDDTIRAQARLTARALEERLRNFPRLRTRAMTESDWLAGDDVAAMLEYLRGQGYAAGLMGRRYGPHAISDRKLRLFACACCRQVLASLADPRSRRAVKVAERYADGEATKAQFDAAHQKFEDSNINHHSETWLLTLRCFWSERFIVEELKQTYRYLLPVTQAALLRDLVGDPFREMPYLATQEGEQWGFYGGVKRTNPLALSVMRWNGGTVPRLAQAIYDERAWSDMPVLADALEEAGCTDADILAHCRGPGPHARGCWVTDLLLGKS